MIKNFKNFVKFLSYIPPDHILCDQGIIYLDTFLMSIWHNIKDLLFVDKHFYFLSEINTVNNNTGNNTMIINWFI